MEKPKIERGISFTPEMVKAILEDRKTMTRRIARDKPRYAVGMKLWVKETWAVKKEQDFSAFGLAESRVIEVWHKDAEDHSLDRGRWRSARFMPKRAARIWLEVVAVRFEPVQDITDAEAKAEGFSSRDHFLEYWDLIYAKQPDKKFITNPLVEAVTFRRIK